jgi:hypothetical protein
LEHGFEVEKVRRSIAERAGILREADAPRLSDLRGFIDRVTPNCIAGWAQNIDHPDAPVCLDVISDGHLLGQVIANQYRADLERAGICSGRHAFSFVPPPDVLLEGVQVRRSLDGAALLWSENARPNVMARAA